MHIACLICYINVVLVGHIVDGVTHMQINYC
jgi:hypothetical protein